MATKKVGSSLELGTMKRPDTNKQKMKPRDILIGLLAGYVIGITLMMIIHFLISKKCINCTGTGHIPGSTDLQEECFEGWIILAGEKTCFYDSYFDVNWTIVGPFVRSNSSDSISFFQYNEYRQEYRLSKMAGIGWRNEGTRATRIQTVQNGWYGMGWRNEGTRERQ